MLPGGPAGTMCSESLWVANPELPLLCLPGPYQNVGAQEQRGLCSGVRDLAGASPYGARRWPFPTAIYWLEIPHLGDQLVEWQQSGPSRLCIPSSSEVECVHEGAQTAADRSANPFDN